MHTLTVYGEPKGKGRPRFARQGNFVKTYTDAQTIGKENEIKRAFSISGLPKIEKGNQIVLHCRVFRPIPASTPKKLAPLMLSDHLRPTTRPDADNYLKLACDALNKLAWDDDSQIVDMRCEKLYSNEPRLEISYSIRV